MITKSSSLERMLCAALFASVGCLGRQFVPTPSNNNESGLAYLCRDVEEAKGFDVSIRRDGEEDEMMIGRYSNGFPDYFVGTRIIHGQPVEIFHNTRAGSQLEELACVATLRMIYQFVDEGACTEKIGY